MSSNEWHQWQPTGGQRPDRRPYQSSYPGHNPNPRPFMPEETLKQLFVDVERKLFIIALKENQNGRFLRITEEVGEKRNTVIVPEAGLEDFLTVVIDMVQASKKIPAKPMGEAPPQ